MRRIRFPAAPPNETGQDESPGPFAFPGSVTVTRRGPSISRSRPAEVPTSSRELMRLTRRRTVRGAVRGVPRTLTEIARELGLAKSSVSNLCAALEEGGLVRRISAGYLLGRRTVELGSAFLAGFNQIREFYRVCEESEVLRNQLVQIALLDGAQVLYLAVFEGRQRFPMSASVGDRYPASVTVVGTVLLSELTPARSPISIGTPAISSVSPRNPRPPWQNCRRSWNAHAYAGTPSTRGKFTPPSSD